MNEFTLVSAIFTMSDAFQPVDRADLREILKNQGLKTPEEIT